MVDYCFTNKSEDDPLILGCSPPLPDIQPLAQQIGTSLSLQEDQLANAEDPPWLHATWAPWC